MDPLRAVRDACANGKIKDCSITADAIVFTPLRDGNDEKNFSIPRGTLTHYRSKVKDQLVSVEAMVFFMQRAMLDRSVVTDPKAHALYLKAAIAAKPKKIPTIPRPDYKGMFNYLTGVDTVSDRVDVSALNLIQIEKTDGEGVAATKTKEKAKTRRTKGEEAKTTKNEDWKTAKDVLTETTTDRENVIKVVPYATRNAALKRKKDFTSCLEKFDGYVNRNNKANKLRETDKPKELVEAEKIVERGQRRNRYQEKVEEQTFWKERVGSDFNELFGNDLGSFGGKGGFDPNASFLSQPKKKKAIDESVFLQDEDALGAQQERPDVRQRQTSVARGSSKQPPSSSTGVSASRKHKAPKTVKRQGTPLILLPAGLTAKVVLNMFNAKNFLEKEKFKPWQDLQKEAAKNRMKKPTHATLLRTYKRDQPVKYEITDQVPRISEDWKRVVAVFVHGAKWQFKDWPKHVFPGAATGDLVETFSKTRGFYAKFEQDATPDLVKTWNIKLLTFPKNQRHGDRAVACEFWDELDRHLALKRSNLLY